MGYQTSGGQPQKGGQPPNPNYGSTGGVDNSNGVYNASAQLAGASTGSTPNNTTTGTAALSTTPTGTLGATGTTTPATVTGATGATTTASATATPMKGTMGGSKAGQPPAANGYPTANNSMTADQALAANQRPAEYTDYDGKDHTADKAAWDAWNARQQQGAAGATGSTQPAGLPPGMAALAQNKAQSKGGTPPAAQGGMTTTPPEQTAATGWAGMLEKQKAGQAAYESSPQWMKNMLTGVDSQGRDNKARADLEQSTRAAGGDIKFDAGTDKNWQAWVQKTTGQTDAFAAMKQLADVARNSKGGIAQLNNMHRAMMASGIEKNTADRVVELFHNTGSNQEQAARRLGVYDQYAKAFTKNPDAAIAAEKENAAWHAANKGKPVALDPGVAAAFAGATKVPTYSQGGSVTTAGATGATGTTDLTGGRNATGSTGGAPTIAQVAQSPQVAQIAKQYGVTPEIAAQIYQQILQQSQSSGGGQ